MDYLKRPVLLKGFKDENFPYFFRNDEIDDGKQTYIVQKASTIGQALAICYRWKLDQYNLTDSTTDILYHVPYTKYIYNSNTDITKVLVTPDEIKEPAEKKTNKLHHNRPLEILLYKKDGRINIVSLLPYSHHNSTTSHIH